MIRCIFLLAALLTGGQSVWAAPSDASVQAGLIARMPLLVSWSHHHPSTIPELCTLGSDPVTEELRYQVLHAQVLGSVRLRGIVDAKQARGCDMLYVAEAHVSMIADVQAAAGGRLLTVAPSPDRPYPGLMVAIFRCGPDVCFSLNRSAAREVGIRFSSKLLKLAQSVR